MKRIVIIDDEPLARNLVMEYLTSYPHVKVEAECNNGYEGLKAIQQFKPDLIFLDIQMPKINGFEMLELLEESPSVIFTTAFDEYAIKAFEANAVDYLLKPFSEERFKAAMEKWMSQQQEGALVSPPIKKLLENERMQEENNRIVVKNHNEITIVPVSEVVYMEAYDDYVKIFTKESYFLKKKTMNFYEATLDPSQFFRTHRSYIINLSELTRIESYEKNSYIALLKSGKKIPLSRTGYSKLKEKLGI